MSPSVPASNPVDADRLTPIVEQALAVVHREYPNQIVHSLGSEADVAAPRALTPAFWGAFDWHSSVHTHWLLARALRLFPEAGFAAPARDALARSLTAEHLAAEACYVETRPSFEVPYGAAWLLTLDSELHTLELDAAAHWRAALAPLVRRIHDHFFRWMSRLLFPVRSGLHNQSAFAMGLYLDHTRVLGLQTLTLPVIEKAIQLHRQDRTAPLDYEPSAHDFLSPVLGVADLMRRVYSTQEFVPWLEKFLGEDFHERAPWPVPVGSPDPADGRLAHLDGLNLSRAWMLEAIAAALPADHRFREPLARAASAHRITGLQRALTPHYAGSHWLGTFAMYLITGRGRLGGVR